MTGIDTAMKSGGTRATVSPMYWGSILSSRVYAYAMPTSRIAPPAMIMYAMGLEPYLLDIINETPVIMTAGATPMEMN